MKPRVNSDGNYRLWVIMMCQCRLIDCNKCTALVRNIDDERGYACVGAGGIWGVSVLPFQFCCELKTALKNSLFFFLSQTTEILTQWYLNEATWKEFVSC